jgi:hypothetical protein
MEITLLKKKIPYRIQWEMKKIDTQHNNDKCN